MTVGFKEYPWCYTFVLLLVLLVGLCHSANVRIVETFLSSFAYVFIGFLIFSFLTWVIGLFEKRSYHSNRFVYLILSVLFIVYAGIMVNLSYGMKIDHDYFSVAGIAAGVGFSISSLVSMKYFAEAGGSAKR